MRMIHDDYIRKIRKWWVEDHKFVIFGHDHHHRHYILK